MRYVAIENPGPDSHLVIEQQEEPTCQKDQLLVQVKAFAINRADLLQRQGKYPPPAGETPIPGLELAGIVVSIGENVTAFKPGDRVYGLVAGGAYAEYCCLHQDLAAKMDDNWEFSLAASIPEALMTSYATLFDLGKLNALQKVLMHGAGSGISCFAIQMANLQGAQVITTASNHEKIEKAKPLGASLIINYKESDFEAAIGEEQIDLIIDFVGGDYFPKHLRLLKPQGKLIQIACMQGYLVECNLALVMRKRLQIIGFILRSQSIEEKAKLWKLAQQQWAGALASKKLIPIIDSKFTFTEIEEAQSKMLANQHFGKIVVLMD